eukprot:TRINITY_DN2028_c0_g1_i4.p1 TRINITY_DN2028_c0_g1~~TRINITY_DN2028_c0_g1_i4.p1  ORF type:complete len:327 (+),score=80.25 TRINITY_DN2028_c0_g1_i4:384-1364(+)
MLVVTQETDMVLPIAEVSRLPSVYEKLYWYTVFPVRLVPSTQPPPPPPLSPPTDFFFQDIFDNVEKCIRVPLMEVALMVASDLNSVGSDDPRDLDNWGSTKLDTLQLLIRILGRRFAEIDDGEGGDGARWNRQFHCRERDKIRTRTPVPALTYADVLQLDKNQENFFSDMSLMKDFREIIDLLKEVIYPNFLVSDSELFDLLCIIKSNSVSVRWPTFYLGSEEAEKDETFSSGIGLYPHASYFNHSCSPNCTSFFDDFSSLAIVTSEFVKQDQELTIGYFSPQDLDAGVSCGNGEGTCKASEVVDGKQTCKKILWEQFRFKCDCKE